MLSIMRLEEDKQDLQINVIGYEEKFKEYLVPYHKTIIDLDFLPLMFDTDISLTPNIMNKKIEIDILKDIVFRFFYFQSVEEVLDLEEVVDESIHTLNLREIYRDFNVNYYQLYFENIFNLLLTYVKNSALNHIIPYNCMDIDDILTHGVTLTDNRGYILSQLHFDVTKQGRLTRQVEMLIFGGTE